MQLTILTRGNYYNVDKYIHDLMALKYKPENPMYKGMVFNVGVRPVQLWEIFFFKEALDLVLAGAQPYDFQGVSSFALKSLRKLLKCKAIPKIIPNNFSVLKKNVQVVGVGIREDEVNEDGYEVI